MNQGKKIARIVGTLFLAGMIIGITGNILIQTILDAPGYLTVVSANSLKLAMGAVLLLFTVAGDAAHGVLMYPILKKHNERIATGYFAFRIIDAVFLGLQVLFILLQIPLGNEYLKAAVSDSTYFHSLGVLFIKANVYSYQLGMVAVGVAGVMLCYSFCKTKLVPRVVAIWGLVGYATIFCGSILEILGFDLRLIHTIIGGLWELFIGIWLLVKGFNPVPGPSPVAKTGTIIK